MDHSAPESYRHCVFRHFESMMATSQASLFSGMNQFPSKDGKLYPVDAFIQTSDRTLILEIRSDNQLVSTDISSIIQERLDPLSKDLEIIAIIESKNGFEALIPASLPPVDYPLILTHQTHLIASNFKDIPAVDGFSFLGHLFDLAMTSSHTSHNWTEEYYELLAFVKDGNVREAVFAALSSCPKYAYEIARELNVPAPSVCRALYSLKNKGLIFCLNPKSKRKKYYQLTAKGRFLQSGKPPNL